MIEKDKGSKTANPRKAILKLLVRMDETGAFSNIILDNALSESGFIGRDRAFFTTLFYGVLERKLTLDYLIRRYSRIEYDKISLAVRQVLRMGIYQIMHMKSVSENAAVNESVNLAPHEAKGFVNGVLRAFLRDGAILDASELEGYSRLSVEYSCPKWLIKMWSAQYGAETTEQFLKSSLGKPPVYIRVNTFKYSVSDVVASLSEDGITVRKSLFADDCLQIERVKEIEQTSSFVKGMFHVQDISSQICCKLVSPASDETVFDMCAAPGGKSFTIAQIMNNRGKIKSFDMYSGKLPLIERGAKRLGLSTIEVAENDAAMYNENFGVADRVLCDVPCSGLGVIRRKPEIKYKPKDNLESLPELQKKILEASSKYVKPGGILVYSTCTLNKAENDDVTDFFQANHPDFIPEYVPVGIPNIDDCSRYTFFPHVTGGDGFYTAIFRRRE